MAWRLLRCVHVGAIPQAAHFPSGATGQLAPKREHTTFGTPRKRRMIDAKYTRTKYDSHSTIQSLLFLLLFRRRSVIAIPRAVLRTHWAVRQPNRGAAQHRPESPESWPRRNRPSTWFHPCKEGVFRNCKTCGEWSSLSRDRRFVNGILRHGKRGRRQDAGSNPLRAVRVEPAGCPASPSHTSPDFFGVANLDSLQLRT